MTNNNSRTFNNPLEGMNCREIQDIIITDYVDNELDGNTKREIDRHVQGCVSCREFMDAVLKTSVEPLRAATPAVPPAFLWQRIANGLERPAAPEGFLSFLRPAWINALAVASMLAFSLFSGNYLARDIWFARTQATETVEVADSLGLNTLGDMPGNQVEQVYTGIVGG